MKIALIGSGGREHAIYWKLKQSGNAEVHVFPGNGGIPSEDRRTEVGASDVDSLRDHLENEKYDLLVVGPEQPLVDGIADAMSQSLPVFGPGADAARIEGSKEWAKDFMQKNGIPTARSFSCRTVEEAYDALEQMPSPYVVKADGLAAGKGVTVTDSIKDARHAVHESLEKDAFGKAGRTVVIEQFLKGREASVFAICDGNKAVPFRPARDHKRAFDGDEGPNTGGMGAVTPVEYLDDDLLQKVQAQVLSPAIAGFKANGSPYKGLLYAGLMVDGDSVNVVEFNCRFGDPETQALLPLLDEDLTELMLQCARGHLQLDRLRFRDLASIVVVLAAEGYPGKYTHGIDLTPLLASPPIDVDTLIFHAGTETDGKTIRSTGGRIAGIVASGSNLEEARGQAYTILDERKVPGTFYRSDIGSLK